MIARACLAIALLAGAPGAAVAVGQSVIAPVANQPPPPPQDEDTLAAEQPVLPVPRFRIPPQVNYPVEALRNDMGGRCIVTFTVGAGGAPQDIVPDCTNPVFTAAARDAVAAARLDMRVGVKPGDTLRLPLRFQPVDWDGPQP